jgi:hypothetical protein
MKTFSAVQTQVWIKQSDFSVSFNRKLHQRTCIHLQEQYVVRTAKHFLVFMFFNVQES